MYLCFTFCRWYIPYRLVAVLLTFVKIIKIKIIKSGMAMQDYDGSTVAQLNKSI